jgi:NTE family protein
MQLALPKFDFLECKQSFPRQKKALLLLALTAGAFAPQPLMAQPTSDMPLQAVLKHHNDDAKRARVILALGGGGTRGCAHIGVLRVLEKEGIPIDGIVGTSIGAIVGGLYAAGMKTDQIEHRMLNRSLLKAYQTVPIPLRVALIPLFFVPRIIGYKSYDGLYKGNRFRNYLNNAVPETDREIEALPIPFVAVASNLLDAKPYAIAKGNLGLAIQASSAIPVLRRPVPMNGLLLIDGGLQANLPVKQAKELGGDIVIAVDVDEQFTTLDEKEFRRIGSVGKRVINMVLAKVDEDQRAAADVLIQPNVNNISLLSTKSKDARRAIEQGESAATAALPAIRTRLEKVAKLKLADQMPDTTELKDPQQVKSAE